MIDIDLIRSRYAGLSPHLDERGRRLFAATEAGAAGYGGIVAVSRATGIAPSTIGRGLRELDEADPLPPGWVLRVRRQGKPVLPHSRCRQQVCSHFKPLRNRVHDLPDSAFTMDRITQPLRC